MEFGSNIVTKRYKWNLFSKKHKNCSFYVLKLYLSLLNNPFNSFLNLGIYQHRCTLSKSDSKSNFYFSLHICFAPCECILNINIFRFVCSLTLQVTAQQWERWRRGRVNPGSITRAMSQISYNHCNNFISSAAIPFDKFLKFCSQ